MTCPPDETNIGPREPQPRVVVLMGPSSGSQYVFSKLAAAVELVAVVRQERPRREVLRAIFRRGKKLRRGYWLDRLLLGAYTKLHLKRRALACPEYREVQAAGTFTANCPVLRVESINDPAVIELLKQSQPDLVVVLGTSILKESVLAAAACFVNLHVGITPMYRGAHGQFWAVVHRDFENLGTTLHFVDKGIDTGAILKQRRFPFDAATDNLLTLLAKSSVVGAKMLLEWIHENRADFRASQTMTPPGPSRLCYSPGLSDYRTFERIAREQIANHSRKVA